MNIKKICAVLAAVVISVTAATVTAFAAETAKTASKSTTIAINEKNFPDELFRGYISDNFDTNYDGKLSQKERDAVKEIYCSWYEIESLKGVEKFKNLEKLTCVSCKLTKLDVSKNTKLKELDCSDNKLEKLDLSKNKKLKVLVCWGNKIKKLNVSKCNKNIKVTCHEGVKVTGGKKENITYSQGW